MNWLQKISKEGDKPRICPECFALHDKRYVYTGYCINCDEPLKKENKN